MREELREKIAGEVTLSVDAGKTIRKWREEFGISQQELARHMRVSPSVISDYESGRRKSPGIAIVRRIVDGLISLDEAHGGAVVKRYGLGEKSDAIISIKEFRQSLSRINAGFFVLKRDIFKYMHAGEELVIEPFQRLIGDQQLAAYEYDGFFGAMDTFKDKQQLDDLYEGGQPPWEVWNEAETERRGRSSA